MLELSKEPFDETTRTVFEKQRNQWLWLSKELEQLKQKLKEQAKQDSALENIYRSTPGIGAIHARILANELGDMSQFSHEKKLFSYTGLTPSEHSSGEHRWLGHISRQGSALLRKVLIQAAWRAIEKDKHLREAFERISKRAGKKRAIVACARKLIGRIRACFVYKQAYSFA